MDYRKKQEIRVAVLRFLLNEKYLIKIQKSNNNSTHMQLIQMVSLRQQSYANWIKIYICSFAPMITKVCELDSHLCQGTLCTILSKKKMFVSNVRSFVILFILVSSAKNKDYHAVTIIF